MTSQWSIRLPSGEYLDTPEDFALQFEFNNQVFSTGDASILPGAFSFPVSVTLTPRMRQQLHHPDRIDNASYFQSIEGVVVCVDNNPIFPGTLKLDKVQGDKISFSIIVNLLAAFKKTNLDQLDFGGARTVAPASTWQDLMLDTAEHPEDYDFAFFPVIGAEVNNSDAYFPNGADWFLQNEFDEETGVFTDSAGVYSPFIKLEYLLEKIFSNLGEGYAFQNAWQNTIELRRLYVYNNADARVFEPADPAPTLPTEFRLNAHAPKIPATEFLKKLTAQWGLGMFPNHFNRTFRLVSLSTVLAKATKWDWTQYVSSEPTIGNPDVFPSNFNYSNANSPRPDWPAPHNAEHIDTYKEYQDSVYTQRYVHIETDGLIIDTEEANFPLKLNAGLYTDDAAETFDPGMESLFCGESFGVAMYESSSLLSRWVEEDLQSGGTEWKFYAISAPVALMFYRGIQNLESGGFEFPVACNHVWNTRVGYGTRLDLTEGGTVLGQAEWSLNWEGEYGLYNKAWKQWHTMLTQGKHVTQLFTIPLTVLRAFSFEDKIRVGNMDFFLKKMRIQKLLADGQVQIDVAMVSII